MRRHSGRIEHLQWDGGPVEIRGALDIEKTAVGMLPRRLPAWTKRQIPDAFCEMVVAQPAGVRLEFATDATEISLDVLTTKYQFRGMAGPRWGGKFEIVVDGEPYERVAAPDGNLLIIDPDHEPTLIPGPSATVQFRLLSSDLKNIEVWLPQSTRVELIKLRTNGSVYPPEPSVGTRWVHYGSSISQCAEADSPLDTWPVIAARSVGIDLLNLALGGNALLDPFVARSIRDLSTDLISLKIGMNVVNLDAFRSRTFAPAVHGFLDTIRDGHEIVPLLVISPTYCPMIENHTGPTVADFDRSTPRFRSLGAPAGVVAGALTLTEIRRALARIVDERAAFDSNLYYLDGRVLFGPGDVDEMPDGLHPNAVGYRRMGERFADFAFRPDGPFVAARHT